MPNAEPAALFAAAQQCATQMGLPVVLEDEEVHRSLRLAEHNPGVAERHRLVRAAGFHTHSAEEWHFHKPALRVLCTAPTDPRPLPMWDKCLWLQPSRLLTQGATQ